MILQGVYNIITLYFSASMFSTFRQMRKVSRPWCDAFKFPLNDDFLTSHWVVWRFFLFVPICLTRHPHSLRAHRVCIHLRVLRALQWIQHGHVQTCAHGLIVHMRSARWSFLHCQPSCFTASGDLPDLQYAAVYSNVWWGVIGSKYPHVSTASVPWQMWMLLIAAYLVPDTVDEDGEAKLWNSLKQISKLFQMVANIWRFFHIFPTVLVSKCQGLPKTLRTVLYLDVLHLDQQVPGFAAAFLELLGPKKMRLLVTASDC